MMKHFLLCLRGSQGVTIAFFDCIGRCVGTAPPTPRFAASTCGWRTLVLGGFHRSGLPLRFGLPLGELTFRLTTSAFRHAPLRSCRSAGWPSGSLLPLFGMHHFGVAAGRVGFYAFRFGVAARRVGLRAHRFRFSACAASEWPLGEFVLPPSVSEIALGGLGFGLTASAFRHAPLRGCPRRVDLRAHDFRFSVRTASGLPSAGWFFHSSGWFFRLPLRKLPSAGWPSGSLLPFFGTRRFGVAAGRVGSSAFRFGDGRRASWPSGSLLPLFGMHRFGVALGGLAFGLTASDFRHAPIRSGRWAVGLRAYCFGDCHLAGWPLGSLLRKFRSAGWPSGSLLPLFGTHRFGDCPRRVGLRAHCFRFSACADPHRRAAEARTDGAQRHDNCFTSKHLSQHVNLPHRTP